MVVGIRHLSTLHFVFSTIIYQGFSVGNGIFTFRFDIFSCRGQCPQCPSPDPQHKTRHRDGCRVQWCGRQDSNLHALALEPKSNESTNSTTPAYYIENYRVAQSIKSIFFTSEISTLGNHSLNIRSFSLACSDPYQSQIR